MKKLVTLIASLLFSTLICNTILGMRNQGLPRQLSEKQRRATNRLIRGRIENSDYKIPILQRTHPKMSTHWAYYSINRLSNKNYILINSGYKLYKSVNAELINIKDRSITLFHKRVKTYETISNDNFLLVIFLEKKRQAPFTQLVDLRKNKIIHTFQKKIISYKIVNNESFLSITFANKTSELIEICNNSQEITFDSLYKNGVTDRYMIVSNSLVDLKQGTTKKFNKTITMNKLLGKSLLIISFNDNSSEVINLENNKTTQKYNKKIITVTHNNDPFSMLTFDDNTSSLIFLKTKREVKAWDEKIDEYAVAKEKNTLFVFSKKSTEIIDINNAYETKKNI